MQTAENGRSKVALDLDGVIWDLVTPWITEYNKKYNDNVDISTIKEYDLSKTCLKASLDELCAIIADKDFWGKVDLFPGAFSAIKQLNDETNLMIATKTDYRLFEIKVNRLLTLLPFLSPSQIICIQDKSLLDIDYLVDDCVENLRKGKFKKIVYDASYNRDEFNYDRVFNLYDVIKFIRRTGQNESNNLHNFDMS